MELTIKVSNIMNKESAGNDLYEHRIIRIPADVRKKYNFHLNEFIYLRDKYGGIITLQVTEAFKEDVIINPTCGYVTENNYKKLLLKSNDFSEVTKVAGITLGCDPEAFLVDNTTGNLVAAHRFLKKHGDVGHDGLLLEFRPLPSTNETVVTANIANLIKKAREVLKLFPEGNKISMIGGSSYKGLTAGFHLHYGLPRDLLVRSPMTTTIARLMTKAFDYYIGVPSIIPEGSEDHSRRTTQYVEYGKPGGYRMDNRTFEYRLPGGINLRHPCLTRGLMALGAVVVEDLVSRVRTSTDFFSNLKEVASDDDLMTFYPNLPSVETLYATICNPEISLAREHFEIIKKDVRQMIGYKERSDSVESYFSCIDHSVKYDANLEHNWGGFSNA